MWTVYLYRPFALYTLKRASHSEFCMQMCTLCHTNIKMFEILSRLVFRFKTESDLHLLKFFGIFWPLIV